MIEINLSPTKKGEGSELQQLISQIDLKMMVIAVAIFFIPEYLFLSINESEKSGYVNRTTAMSNELKSLNKKLDELQKIEQQIDALKALEKTLSEKLEVVKQIFSKRQNPFYLMQYVAQNIPNDVWIMDFSFENSQVVIKGFAGSWKSIGIFLENLKSSIFFDKNMKYEQPNNVENKDRKEYFVITAKLIRYE